MAGSTRARILLPERRSRRACRRRSTRGGLCLLLRDAPRPQPARSRRLAARARRHHAEARAGRARRSVCSILPPGGITLARRNAPPAVVTRAGAGYRTAAMPPAQTEPITGVVIT